MKEKRIDRIIATLAWAKTQTDRREVNISKDDLHWLSNGIIHLADVTQQLESLAHSVSPISESLWSSIDNAKDHLK